MTASLRFDHVSFSYPGGGPVLSQVTAEVPAGSFALLVGATGCGKTTLLRCAKASLAPAGNRSGRIEVGGKDALALDPATEAATIGYVAQSPENQLVCHTVWHEMAFGLENLGVPSPEMRRRVADVAHFFGMEPWFQKEVEHLSGGQKQLLNLASVLVMQPKVLLLDEPTSQLDPVAQRTFCHALFRLNRELGLTLLVATHTPQLFASYATHAFALGEDGLRPCSLDDFRDRGMTEAELAAVAACGREAELAAAAVHGCETELVAVAVHGCEAELAAVAARGRGVEEGTSSPKNPKSAVALRAQDMFVRYGRGEDFVLRSLDLEVRQGGIHALVGGNGCGKTTLLKVLAGVVKPARGKVWNGLRSQQAYIPQDPKALFVADTVEEELQEWSRPCGYGEDEIRRWLRQTGLAGHEGQHPYDLSGGQQQLLAFAKVALAKPGLLLLDEPAKGLDAAAKLLLAQQLQALARQGTTVVMATHDLAFAACLAQEVSLLFDGQVTCTEPPEDFFHTNVFYRPQADAFVQAWLSAGPAGD